MFYLIVHTDSESIKLAGWKTSNNKREQKRINYFWIINFGHAKLPECFNDSVDERKKLKVIPVICVLNPSTAQNKKKKRGFHLNR